jgi:hypothetical protein
MNNGTKIVLGVMGIIFALVLVVGLTLFGTGVGVYNGCIEREKGIEKQYADNQNIYDNYVKKVLETSQVSSKYANNLKSIYVGAISSRYGDTGSKAVFQWIQEHNPNLYGTIYIKIQNIIESGRNDFTANQTTLLARKAIYEVYIQSFPNNLFAKALGFPKIDMNKYDIITSNDTEKAFETKKVDAIKIN